MLLGSKANTPKHVCTWTKLILQHVDQFCCKWQSWPWSPTMDARPALVHQVVIIYTIIAGIIIYLVIVGLIIIITRPKPAYGRQGLAGSWGQDTDKVRTFLVFLTSHFAPAALSSDLNQPWSIKIHLES